MPEVKDRTEEQDLKVCGKYCGECVHAQYGSGDEKEHYTFCQALATQVRNTDNPLDQCPYCVLEG